MHDYAAQPSTDQLDGLAAEILPAGEIRYVSRLMGGLGCTMDVLEAVTATGTNRLVLRRYGPWTAETGEDPAPAEFRALELAAGKDIPAPDPVWIDRIGLFEERAIVISFMDGTPLLTPLDPLDWAEQLAAVLTRIHEINVEDSDSQLFPRMRPGDEDPLTESEPAWIAQHPLGATLWRRRLHELASAVDQPDVFLHTDFWPGNTLWRASSLAAVVDWEGCSVGDPAMDVAYCATDMRYLSFDDAASHFVETYQALTGRELANLAYWELVALCRPMPDIAQWVSSWRTMGLGITTAEAQARHVELIQAAVS